MSTSSVLHCVICNQALPEGKEPEYFGQVSVGYKPEYEVQRAAEDVSQFLRYAKTVNEALWHLIQVADAEPEDLCDPEAYLDTARSLCFFLTDLADEANRRIRTLDRLVNEKLTDEEARSTQPACKKEEN